jgi:GAF domain-containing protein
VTAISIGYARCSTDKQDLEANAGEHTIAELAELFEVSRPTVYRVLERASATTAAVNDAVADPRTLDHPLVRGELGLRFDATAPIVTADGHHLGTVTAIDATLRQLTEAQKTVLDNLADQVAQHLELRLARDTPTRLSTCAQEGLR